MKQRGTLAVSLGLDLDPGSRTLNQVEQGLARGRNIRRDQFLDAPSLEPEGVRLSFLYAQLMPDLGNDGDITAFDLLARGEEQEDLAIVDRLDRVAAQEPDGLELVG